MLRGQGAKSLDFGYSCVYRARHWRRQTLLDCPRQTHFSTSQQETDMVQIPRALFERLMDTISYAA